MKKMLAIAVILLSLPALASASGIVGQCADCHTMHNSEQGQNVARIFASGSLVVSDTPLRNLLRYDCIACHAQNNGKLVELDGGSIVPQVYHSAGTSGDLFRDNLAAGNFRYIEDGGSDRKGHNVRDLFSAGDAVYDNPPGFFPVGNHSNKSFSGNDTVFGAAVANFTCAGSAGCHGTRAQELADGSKRTGLAAVSGAHHNSRDGLKQPDAAAMATPGEHDGAYVAASYRFIRGLWGYGNTGSVENTDSGEPVTVSTRWQNVDASNHNEYFGVAAPLPTEGEGGDACVTCHIRGQSIMAADSTLQVPNQSMSGFCATCHSTFHSAGAVEFDGVTSFIMRQTLEPTGNTFDHDNGASGAFLRHPSDYVLPARGEYDRYTTYSVTAPVARQALPAAPQASVARGDGGDMVMCLSCHVAHASPYEGMLRFDYTAMVAGGGTEGTGCLACHTLKGYPGSAAP